MLMPYGMGFKLIPYEHMALASLQKHRLSEKSMLFFYSFLWTVRLNLKTKAHENIKRLG